MFGKQNVRVRRSAERGFEDFGWADNWMTFSFGGYRDPEWNNFGPLRVMVENHIQPHSGFQPHSHRDVEIITYVAAGVLSHRDSFGNAAGISSGEMQHISAGTGMVHAEENLHGEVEHNLQIWLVPERRGTEFAYQQLRFTPEERQGRFRLYVSPDAREGSMPINTDARVYAGLFQPGDRIEHVMSRGRGAWVQVVRGNVRVAATELNTGDGAGITGATELSFEFGAETEALLFDLRMDAPLIWR